MILDFNLATFVPESGFTAHLYVLGNHGNDPTAFAGDTLASSNIESSENYLKIYEAWVQQDFGKYLQILFGMHDLNSEFYATESSALYTNSNFGIGADLAQTGVNGPSIFPQTAPALRIASQPLEGFNIRVAAYNAQAGNPDSIGQTYARYESEDGLLGIGEITYSWQEKSKFAVGNWTYSKKVERIDEDGTAKNTGTYLLFEQNFAKKFTTFLRYGVANKEVNEIVSTMAVGLTVNRSSDNFGIAFTSAQPNKDLGEKLKPEQVVEATYSTDIIPGLTLQPGIQLIDQPSFGTEISSTQIFYSRITLSI